MVIATLLAAPFVGSFLGTLIRRLPDRRPILWARSSCEACGRTLGPLELVPIASFVLLRGQCRGCRDPVARAHLWIELAAVLVPLSAIAAGARGAILLAGSVLGWTLLAASWIDYEHFRLPDTLTLPLILLGLAATLLLSPEDLAVHALAAVMGYLTFLGIAWVYRSARGREGLGQGDAKLLAAAGAWLGPEALPWVIFVAASCGLLVGLIAHLCGKRVGADTAISFGPCLAAAIWLTWLSGSQ